MSRGEGARGRSRPQATVRWVNRDAPADPAGTGTALDDTGAVGTGPDGAGPDGTVGSGARPARAPADRGGRPGWVPRGRGWWLLAALIAAPVVAEIVLRAAGARPLWYDELWRGRYLSPAPSRFWHDIAQANAPSAAGWLAMTRLVADLGGWHAGVLRIPEFVSLPLLAAATFLLARRYLPTAGAAVAAGLVGLSGTLLDLALQLKPYTIEALTAVVAVAIWAASPGPNRDPDPSDDRARRRTRRRGSYASAALSLFSVPMVFVLVPLTAVDMLLAALRPDPADPADPAGGPARDRRAAARRALRAGLDLAPGLAVCVVHTLVFVARQSGQRNGSFWDGQFPVGLGVWGTARFTVTQTWRFAGAVPTGVDRIDPNLVHPPTDGRWVSAWIIAPLVVACWLAAARVCARDRAGLGLLAVVGGGAACAFVASLRRFWPFGAARTNTFVVPLLVILAVIGALALGRALCRVLARTLAERAGPGPGPGPGPGAGAGARAALSAVAVVVVALLAWDTAATDHRLWASRDSVRLEDRVIDVALAARVEFDRHGPGTHVLVGGRLAQTGWTYAMEVSDDGPSRDAPDLRGASRLPRVPLADTTFVTAPGAGATAAAARAVAGAAPRDRPVTELIWYLFWSDRASREPALAALRAEGWCPTSSRAFTFTGTLTVLGRCPSS